MPSATPAAISPPSKRAALRTSIQTSLENCALRFLVLVDAHHMGSADRCQAPSIPHPTLERRTSFHRIVRACRRALRAPYPTVRIEFTPQTSAALSAQRDS